jgi:hypothetical protein
MCTLRAFRSAGTVAIAVAAPLSTSAPASALTYLEWERGPDTWKRGYLHGLLDHAATHYSNDEHRGRIERRLDCYARVGSSTEQLVRMVTQYAGGTRTSPKSRCHSYREVPACP